MTHHTLIIIMRFLKIKKARNERISSHEGGDQAGLSKQLCTEWLQTRMGHQLTTHFGIHDVRTHLSVRDILELLHMAEGYCIRVYFHNLLNCNQDTLLRCIDILDRTTSHRSRKRSCWFTLTHCFFRRTSKAKTMQKIPKSCQPPAKAQQADPS